MKNKISLGLIAAAGLAVFGAACQGPANNQNASNLNQIANVPPTNSRTTGSFSTSPSQPAAAVVTLTASGLDQPSVTVTVGSRVEFRNGDTASHWVASTPHPTHTDLPGFEKNIPGGGTYSYTFSRTGTFTYYDNSAPDDTRFQGRVVVR